MDPASLVSVIETIAESHYNPSSAYIHVLLDAYATFVNRVRSQSHLLDISDTLLPALAPLKEHKVDFVRALRRDIHLAHTDPFSTLTRSSLDDAAFHTNVRHDTKQYARDASSLCHHALCTLTTIFRFPAFYFAFSDHDLSSLFGDVLDIALADSLPVLNKTKTYSLSLWALGCHRLPLIVLASRQGDLFTALQQSLDSTKQPGNIVLDGLKAISHTIERHPSAFLELLFPLLPYVVTNLDCKSLDHRLHASTALGRFANALIHHSELSLAKWQSLSIHLTSFLESPSDESQEAPRATSLLRMVRAAFSTQSHARPIDAAWILAVLASLIVLCGPPLYSKPTVLQVILQSLAMTLTHKRSIIRAMHPHVWRCFIWTFSQMLFSSENVEPALISAAFYVIKQEVSGGIGVALASVLLSDRIPATRSDERANKISRTLSIVKAMVRTECEHTRRDGFLFLHALTNDAKARYQIIQNTYEIPASVLLNGAIIRAEWDSLPLVIHSIPKVPVSLYWPEEIEIAPHYKTLLVIWKHLASQRDRNHLDAGLVDVWLSILLACSHQLECGEHNSTIAETLRYIAEIIVEFLPPVTSEDRQPDWGSWDVQNQLCCLTFINQLWSAMQGTFAALGLAEAAELVLASILKYAFHVLDPGVQTLWGRLCANLMTTAPRSFLRDAHDSTASQLVIRNRRELWGVVARSLSSSELGLYWKELVKFLAIPVCAWVLSEPELKAWETLLQNVIAISGDCALVTDHIVSQYFLGNGIENWDSILPILGFFLTCAHEHGSSPTDGLLSTVDICLTVCYGRARHSPGVLTYSLRLLNAIRHEITSAPNNMMRVLRVLRSSLCLWIEDREEVMSDNEFNSVAVALYCEALKALKVIPLSVQTLQDTENFLASAFSRIPTPAMAPFAFEDFWRATYHGQSQFCNSLPPKIKSCLLCFVTAYGGDLADGLSSATDSQSQSINNGSQVQSPTGHQQQDTGGFGLGASPSSMSINAGAAAKMEVASRQHQQNFAGQEDETFPLPSPDDDVPQSTVLRQLQEYTSPIDASFENGCERSMPSPRMLSFSASNSMPSSPSPQRIQPVAPFTPNLERKLAECDDATQKRSRACRGALRTMRKLESEPVSRDVTPVDVPRMNSVPLKKRKVFDGIELPTFRQISRRKKLRKGETSSSAIDNRRGIVAVSQTSSESLRRTRGKSRAPQPALPSSVGSDEDDDLDWENFWINGTSSEADVDRSLARALSSSPPRSQSSAIHGLPSTSCPPKAILQSDDVPPIQRAGTTSRLDALQDIYSSVANGASQIPWSELVQATKLVHQIGAVLTEQMGKKMRDPR